MSPRAIPDGHAVMRVRRSPHHVVWATGPWSDNRLQGPLTQWSAAPWQGGEAQQSLPHAYDETALECPVVPGKILAVGANFPDPDEAPTALPSIFTMPQSALVGDHGVVDLTDAFAAALVEGELAVVIGRGGKHLSTEEAMDSIWGYTIVDDLSGRECTLEMLPPVFKKGLDGFLPCGPVVVPKSALDWRQTRLCTRINGDLVQSGCFGDLTHGLDYVVAFISRYITLHPGDLICLGTPPPKPRVVDGDVVSITIDGIGTLTHRMVRERGVRV